MKTSNREREPMSTGRPRQGYHTFSLFDFSGTIRTSQLERVKQLVTGLVARLRKFRSR